jgi:hypothetical protein
MNINKICWGNISGLRTTWGCICAVNQSVHVGVATTMHGEGGDWGIGRGPFSCCLAFPVSSLKSYNFKIPRVTGLSYADLQLSARRQTEVAVMAKVWPKRQGTFIGIVSCTYHQVLWVVTVYFWVWLPTPVEHLQTAKMKATQPSETSPYSPPKLRKTTAWTHKPSNPSTLNH